MWATKRSRVLGTWIVMVPAVWTAGCVSGGDIVGLETVEPTAIVSDLTPFALAQGALGSAATTPSGAAVAYVSLQPGTVPNGEIATITNRRLGITATATMVEGGIDPFPIEAAAGDTLEIDAQVAGVPAAVRITRVVPIRSRPIVVRTNPPPQKRDVPLNASLILVFSEPIDPSTLSRASVQLRRGNEVISGTLSFHDPAKLIADLLPAKTLQASSEYTLLVTQSVKDQDGDPLEVQIIIRFTTADLSGRIAFVKYVGVTDRLEVMDAYVYCLTTFATNANFPEWSPDGTKLAYTSSTGSFPSELSVMNANGSGVNRLTADGSEPAWSPDGSKIAFVRYREKPIPTGSAILGQIYVMNADGSGVRQLISTPFEMRGPSWSPDGRKIAFSGPLYAGDSVGIYVMNADGTNRQRLTTNGDFSPAWSPNGSKIAFSGSTIGGRGIFVMNADGSQPTLLNHEGGVSVDPIWSPDGTKILFAGTLCDFSYGCTPGLFVMNSDGSLVRRATPFGNYSTLVVSPSWTARPARP